MLAYKLSSAGHSHVSSLFVNEQQKRLALDVMDTCATHTGLVRDIKDTRQLRTRLCFGDFQTFCLTD